MNNENNSNLNDNIVELNYEGNLKNENTSINQTPQTKKKNNVLLIIGIILGVILFLSIILIIGIKILFDSFNKSLSKSTIFYGDGYTLEYNNDWNIVSVKTNSGASKKGLKYRKLKQSSIVPVGTSKLDEIDCDFSLSSCKSTIYNEFLSYWSKNIPSSLKIYSNGANFNLIKDDIYYASYNYGLSNNSINGKIYLLISKDKNIILSFMSNTQDDEKIFDSSIIDLLNTIQIEKQEETKKDNTTNDILNSLSNWNKYSNLRTSNLSKEKGIEGNFRILSNSETYWVFKNGEFWWYKSVNDLNDNYWYGTYTVKTGKEGLKNIGIDESKISSILSKSNNITENDIYSLILTPKKIISNGTDKSDTNIPDNSTWNYIWIIVDHGNEGIEGQAINTKNNDTSYYVKIEK